MAPVVVILCLSPTGEFNPKQLKVESSSNMFWSSGFGLSMQCSIVSLLVGMFHRLCFLWLWLICSVCLSLSGYSYQCYGNLSQIFSLCLVVLIYFDESSYKQKFAVSIDMLCDGKTSSVAIHPLK